MSLAELINRLEDQGVHLVAEGDRLRFRGPKGAMTAEDRATLGDQREAVLALLRDRAAAQAEEYPLSHGQQAIWMLERLVPGTAVNNLSSSIRIGTPIDLAASRAAAQRVIDRHPQTRATFHLDEKGVPFQQIAGAALPEVTVHDAEGLEPSALAALVEAERDRPFDLRHGPLMRLALFRCGPDEHVQMLTAHHVICDGMGVLLLWAELMGSWMELRGGATVDLPLLRASYADHVRAEADLVNGPEGERLWDYWRDRLAGTPPLLALPADRLRPAVPSFRGGALPFSLDDATLDRLRALAGEAGTTLFAVMLTTWTMFLAKVAGQSDVIVGTSFSDRQGEATVGVVGDYINALPLRAKMRWSTTFREAIALHRETVVGAMEAQAYPIQLIVNRLQPERGAAPMPLFNCFFNFLSFPVSRDLLTLSAGYGESLTVDGARFHPFRLPQQAGQFDLTLSLSWYGEVLRGDLYFALDLFDQGTVARLLGDYLAFVDRVATDPDAALLPPAERQMLLAGFNDSDAALDRSPFVERFARQAAATPDRVAVRCEGATLDYASLDSQANRLAWRLRGAGVGRGTVVGLLLDRTPALIVALIAVGKAGGIFCPLDPSYPASRLAFMAEDSGMALLLSDTGRPAWLAESSTVEVLDPTAAGGAVAQEGPPSDGPVADDIAYLLYTSGSSGRPNGVEVPQAALSNFLGAMLIEPGLSPEDVLAAVTTVSFDIAMLEMFLPLLVGACVMLVPREIASDGVSLGQLLERSGASLMQATPATWRLLEEAGWRPPAGFRALSGGEAMPPDLAAMLRGKGVELWNLYGPTETTIWSTAGRIGSEDHIDVGRPIANTQIYLLDRVLDPVPVGVEGDIWIGGAGVARGYLNRPELTAERFIRDPFRSEPGARLYRTGDRGRWTPEGRLVHLGRSDEQVKLRGFRVEPGEVEAVLATHPDVRRAVVARQQVGDDARLVAYLVYEPGTAPVTSDLRRHVRRHLPEPMVPAFFVAIDAIPLTPNGKVDRRALPDPFASGIDRDQFSAPAPGVEEMLARIWQEVLGIGRVSADDRFFEIGGHSLLAVRVSLAVERETGQALPPGLLFFQSLRQVAATLTAAATHKGGDQPAVDLDAEPDAIRVDPM